MSGLKLSPRLSRIIEIGVYVVGPGNKRRSQINSKKGV